MYKCLCRMGKLHGNALNVEDNLFQMLDGPTLLLSTLVSDVSIAEVKTNTVELRIEREEDLLVFAKNSETEDFLVVLSHCKRARFDFGKRDQSKFYGTPSVKDLANAMRIAQALPAEVIGPFKALKVVISNGKSFFFC